MKKTTLIAAMALFGSLAMAEGTPSTVDKLLGAVSQEKLTEFAAVFKETSAKYSADYTAFVEACKTAPDKVALVKQYLPKLEKAYEAAKAETVPAENSAQKLKLLAETKGFIAALRKTVEFSPNQLIDKLISAVPQEKILEFAALFKETGAKYAPDYAAFVEAYRTAPDKIALVKQYLPKLENAYNDAKAETVPAENSAQKLKVLAEAKGFITAIKKLIGPAAPTE